MLKTAILFGLFIFSFSAFAQENDSSLYVVRKYKNERSTYTRSIDFYFLKDAGLKYGLAGRIESNDLIKKETHLLYIDVYDQGDMSLAVEFPAGTSVLNFDTLSGKHYVLHNNYTSFENKKNSRDTLTGTLYFTYLDSIVIIDGVVRVGTNIPKAVQELFFREYRTEMLSLEEKINIDKIKPISMDIYARYDSFYNSKSIANNQLEGKLGRRRPFKFFMVGKQVFF
jgi:hypothetical protein